MNDCLLGDRRATEHPAKTAFRQSEKKGDDRINATGRCRTVFHFFRMTP